ncbi:MAG: hypothetical protein P8Y54_09635 [Xanthomonadales bacterium]
MIDFSMVSGLICQLTVTLPPQWSVFWLGRSVIEVDDFQSHSPVGAGERGTMLTWLKSAL